MTAEVLADRDAPDATDGEADREAVRVAVEVDPALDAGPLAERRHPDEHGGDEPAGELQAAVPHRDQIDRRLDLAPVGDVPRDAGADDAGDDEPRRHAVHVVARHLVRASMYRAATQAPTSTPSPTMSPNVRNSIGPMAMIGNVV